MAGSRIAVASGKGGAGKTTIATALAVTLSRSLAEAQLLDCDVEEPDAALFIKPEIENTIEITIDAPEVNVRACTGCGDCREVCQFNAIDVASGKAEVHEASCHGCGACALVCPAGAIQETKRRIGLIESGKRDGIVFHSGTLDVGRHMTARVIRALKAASRSDIPTVLDCPSGTAAPVIASIKNCHYCILVTEPTPFGLYDLRLMVKVVHEVGVPAGIVINKDDVWSCNIDAYASATGIPVLARIPFSRQIALLCSRGIALTEYDPTYDGTFWRLYEDVERSLWKGQ